MFRFLISCVFLFLLSSSAQAGFDYKSAVKEFESDALRAPTAKELEGPWVQTMWVAERFGPVLTPKDTSGRFPYLYEFDKKGAVARWWQADEPKFRGPMTVKYRWDNASFEKDEVYTFCRLYKKSKKRMLCEEVRSRNKHVPVMYRKFKKARYQN